MGVYVFRTDVLLKLLTRKYLSCNDFGSEIIPLAVKDHNVQVSDCSDSIFLCSLELFFNFHSSWFLDLSKLGLNSIIKLLSFLISLYCQAYLFNDYWEDIGTIKSFFDANLALTEQVCIFICMYSY